jgi:hypothetical protein
MLISMPRELAALTANPFESRYSSIVIWKLSLIRRFLTSTRLNSSVRRFIEPPFHSVLDLQTPLSYSGVLHVWSPEPNRTNWLLQTRSRT